MQKWCNCNCNWIWFSICCRNCNCNWIFAVIEFNYSQLLSITAFIWIIIFSDVNTLAIEWPATTPVEISVLIYNCQLWFTPLTLCTNDCNEQTLPAASSCLISLILYIRGGFPYCWHMPIHSLGQSKLFSWPDKTNDTHPYTTNNLSWFGKVYWVIVLHKLRLSHFGFATGCYV